MNYEGKQLEVYVACGECGSRLNNTLSPKSAFILGSCRNSECVAEGQRVLVEKASMQIIQCGYFKPDGTTLYPMLADKDGK